MILRGAKFGHVFNASGARGFWGEGYWFHKYFEPLGLDYEGSTFIAKTTTMHPRQGNMPLSDNGITPQQLLPKCIKVNVVKGAVLNSVGLSGPGAAHLLRQGYWQHRQSPFLISFMSVEKRRDQRLSELREFVSTLKARLPDFQAPVGLQINFSCPNVAVHLSELAFEIRDALDIAADLQIPLIPKVNALFPVDLAVSLSEHANFDALSVSNTIPWEQVPENVRKDLFRSTTSPLASLGGGGLSGARYLLDLTSNWVANAREDGFTKPIIGGGGVLSVKDAEHLLDVGATSIELGSVSILRPWRVRKIIEYVNLRTCDA